MTEALGPSEPAQQRSGEHPMMSNRTTYQPVSPERICFQNWSNKQSHLWKAHGKLWICQKHTLLDCEATASLRFHRVGHYFMQQVQVTTKSPFQVRQYTSYKVTDGWIETRGCTAGHFRSLYEDWSKPIPYSYTENQWDKPVSCCWESTVMRESPASKEVNMEGEEYPVLIAAAYQWPLKAIAETSCAL
jgi:hypothetical protein